MSTPSGSLPVIGAAPGTTMAQLEPGKKFAILPPAAVPQFGVAEWVPAGDNTYRLVARTLPRWHVINGKTMRLLGIACSPRTLVRLMDAGFIETRRPTPNTREFSYDSYLAHVAATADPEFWSQTAPGQKFTNLQRYQQAL